MAARRTPRGSAPGPRVDEFTVPAEKSRLLERSRGRIEGLFEVRLAVLGAQGDWRPALQPPNSSARIWVQLAGCTKAVGSAKEYIKGLCEPELEEKEYYPKDMHCIFVGAQSLFLNSLIRDTCADVTVLEMGMLSIKGGAEAVVMAQSHVQQFVKLFENNESLLTDNESEIKKQFRQFVEAHADKYTMDLLILPSALKRELLALTQTDVSEGETNVIDLTASESPQQRGQNSTSKVIAANRDGRADGEEARSKAGTPVTELTKQMDTVFSDAPETRFVPIKGPLVEAVAFKERQSCKRRSSDEEERLPKKHFSLENDQQVKSALHKNTSEPDAVIDLVLDSCNEADGPTYCLKEGDALTEEMEYKILVNFFRTMGYSQDIVEKVIGILGQSVEPLILLEEIEKENLKFKKEHEQSQKPRTVSLPLGNNVNNSQKLEDKGISGNKSPLKSTPTSKETKNEYHKVRGAPDTQVGAEDKMYKLVCKSSSPPSKNSVLCYKQRDVYGPGKNHNSRSNNIETDGGVAFSAVQAGAPKGVGFVARGSSDPQHISSISKTAFQQKSAGLSAVQNSHPGCEEQLGHCSSSQARPLHQHLSQSSHCDNPVPDRLLSSQQHPSYPDRDTTAGPHPDHSVTGVQRFLDSLKKPYKLELINEPGKPYLKHIIIDGSNVAISHGLRKFFSCRGIAIAVDYFWKRGHRNITVFVPQWRTRRDPSITEQNFLTQLEDVGILSLTPARMVLGARIAAHDDRFLLHLAAKTGGVIVTNDNFREFVTESYAWREIIQKRLLQYTFAGDIFMVPDDPLGRNGPRLDDFLRSEGCSRDSWSTQKTLKSSGQYSSETPFFLPEVSSSSWQPGGRVHDDRSSPWLPWEENTEPRPATPPQRSASETVQLREALIRIFPDYDQRQKIDQILADHPFMRDLNALSAMVLD
ncbi:N4BP1 protein, partial [Oxylabes madagascariensis]|nr:N4BP1 protein [Oxylabes madagascariensis]